MLTFIYLPFDQDIETSWTRLVEVSKQRTEDLDNELKTQQENEELRKTFANLANEFGPWMRKQYDVIIAIIMNSISKVEDNDKRHLHNRNAGKLVRRLVNLWTKCSNN